MKTRTKVRADELVHERGIAESRNKAQALIMAGRIFYHRPDGSGRELVRKSGQLLTTDVILGIEGNEIQDVGRGALKLREAFRLWPELERNAKGALALDIGASTGGFTQVMLERGADKVVALDVGTHQLHERLRADSRVLSLEKTHVLHMDAAAWRAAGVEPPFDFIVTDVSFISSTRLVAVTTNWLKPGAPWILLVKPQFEVGPKKAPRGIVRNPEYHEEALEMVRAAILAEGTCEWVAVIDSPIAGGDGNKEFLAWIRKR